MVNASGIETRREASEEFLEEVQKNLAGFLEENEIPARIEEDVLCELEGEQQQLYQAELKRATIIATPWSVTRCASSNFHRSGIVR